MSSHSRTTSTPSARLLRSRDRRTAGKPAVLRRQVLVPVAIASITLVTAGCGGTDVPAEPSAASRPASAGSAPGSATPSGTDSADPTPAATGGSADPKPAGTAGAGSTDRRCKAEGLKMSLGRSDAGAGQIYYRLTLTNESGAACTLRGFPGVSLIKRDGSVIGVPAEREGGMPEQTVIGPGRTAGVTLHTLNQGIKDSGCWARPDYLRVYPPGSRDALTLRTSLPHICGDRFTTTAVAG